MIDPTIAIRLTKEGKGRRNEGHSDQDSSAYQEQAGAHGMRNEIAAS